MFPTFLFLPVLGFSVFGNKKSIGVGSTGSECSKMMDHSEAMQGKAASAMKSVLCIVCIVSAYLASWALDLLSSNTDGWNSSVALTSEIG